MSETTEQKFKKAVWLIRNGPKRDSSNEIKLNFYKYFKQVYTAFNGPLVSNKIEKCFCAHQDRYAYTPRGL